MSNTTDGFRNAPTTRGGFVLVSLYSWMGIAWAIMTVRLVLGLVIHRMRFGKDDVTALIGSFVFMGVVVSGQHAVDAGLGKAFADVNVEDAISLSKALYIEELFSVAAMAFGKLSFAFLIARVVPQTQKATTVLFGMIGFWSIFSIFATAFKCGVPKVWNSEILVCGHSSIALSVVILNIASDVVLTAWILPTLKALTLDRTSYWTATILFGCRALVPLIATLQIWLAVEGETAFDAGKYAVDTTVLSHAVTCLSLITASIPRIKRSLAISSSGILYPQIHETELSTSRRRFSSQTTANAEPRLVPIGNSKFSATITAKGKKVRAASPQPNWQGLVSIGRKEDDHTSTSSLFDQNEHGGVMLHQDFTVEVENISACREQ